MTADYDPAKALLEACEGFDHPRNYTVSYAESLSRALRICVEALEHYRGVPGAGEAAEEALARAAESLK
jgi:hypothetical protein